MRYCPLVFAGLLLLSGLTGGCKSDEVEALEQEVLAQQGEIVRPAADTAAADRTAPAGAEEAPVTGTGEPKAETVDGAIGGSADAADEWVETLSPGAIPSEGVQAAESAQQRPSGEGYEVQLSAGTDREHAAYVVENFRRHGYEPYTTTAVINGQEYFRVRLGIFSTRTEALRIQQELAEKFSIESWVDTAH